MTHTPGPWFRGAQCDGYVQVRTDDTGTPNERRDCISNEWTVAQVNDCMGHESWANANLIAAAPDMLAACQRILRAVRWSVTEDRMTPDQQADVLSAAIAKATGEEVTK